jgi:hypothetical protein
MKKKRKVKKRVNIKHIVRRAVKISVVYYLSGFFILSAYLFFTYTTDQCDTLFCLGRKTMLINLVRSSDFWITVVPIWPVIIPMDILTKK